MMYTVHLKKKKKPLFLIHIQLLSCIYFFPLLTESVKKKKTKKKKSNRKIINSNSYLKPHMALLKGLSF